MLNFSKGPSYFLGVGEQPYQREAGHNLLAANCSCTPHTKSGSFYFGQPLCKKMSVYHTAGFSQAQRLKPSLVLISLLEFSFVEQGASRKQTAYGL